MRYRFQQLILLLALLLAVSVCRAEAGFITAGSAPSVFSSLSNQASEGSAANKDSRPSPTHRLNLFQPPIANLLQFTVQPQDSGMSSGPVSPSHASPFAMISQTLELVGGSLSHKCQSNQSFVPQQTLVDIFHPPCA